MKKFLSMLLTLVLTAALFAVPAMAEGKTVIAAIEGDPQQMDPTLNSYSRSSKVLQNLFKGLYKLDADGATYVPAMAESCEVSEDGLTYTFTLRDGLKSSDGSDLTAYDFEYSWLRVLNPEIGSKCVSDLWLIENAQAYYNGECAVEDVGIKAEDEKTFVVRLNAPTPWFLSLIATSSFLPVSKANVEANPNWTSDVATYVSNGPFMLKEYSSLNRLVLVKNPYYYMADDVKIDEVDFVIIEDATTELTAYNNGEINIGFLSNTISSDGLIQYKDSDEFHEQGKIGIQYCDFNTQLPEFSDSRVRRAFAMAIDRQAMLDALGVIEKPVLRLRALCAAVPDRFLQVLSRRCRRHVRRGRGRRAGADGRGRLSQRRGLPRCGAGRQERHPAEADGSDPRRVLEGQSGRELHHHHL